MACSQMKPVSQGACLQPLRDIKRLLIVSGGTILVPFLQVPMTKAPSTFGNIEGKRSFQLIKLKLSAFRRPRKTIGVLALKKLKLLLKKEVAPQKKMETKMNRRQLPSLKTGPYLKDAGVIVEVSKNEFDINWLLTSFFCLNSYLWCGVEPWQPSLC